MQTVQAIEGAIPILHAGPGCAEKLTGSAGSSGHFSSHIFPCTNISEKEVVFGGESRLRDVVENSLKVIDAGLYVVLTGCTQELVGDDVESVVRGFSSSEKPVVYASTAGFKGNNYQGHDWVQKAIFDQYLEPAGSQTKGLVNIWAGPPQQDPFWLGNLRELERLVSSLGLIPNTIFGHDRGLGNLRRVPAAELNLLVSPWVGLESVRFLEAKFGTPYLHYPVLPIGAFETSKFLWTLGERLGVDPALVKSIADAGESEYYYYIERFADIFLETRVMSKRFTVISDAQYALAITKFLVNDVGLFPGRQYITDNAPEEFRPAIEAAFADLNWGIRAEVEFSSDGWNIHEQVKADDYAGYPLILGSSWEKQLARDTKAHFLAISWPNYERLVINSSYVGYAGGLKLLEDIYSVVLTRYN